MFAVKTTTAFVTRALLIAVILFNALIPTSVEASSFSEENESHGAASDTAQFGQIMGRAQVVSNPLPEVNVLYQAIPSADRLTPSLSVRKVPTTALSPTQDVVFRCVYAYWPSACPTPADMSPYESTQSYSVPWGGYNYFYGHFVEIVCPPENPTCFDDYDVYYHFAFDFAWSSSYSHDVTIRMELNSSFTPIPCGTGLSGSCSGVVEGVFRPTSKNLSAVLNWTPHKHGRWPQWL